MPRVPWFYLARLGVSVWHHHEGELRTWHCLVPPGGDWVMRLGLSVDGGHWPYLLGAQVRGERGSVFHFKGIFLHFEPRGQR